MKNAEIKKLAETKNIVIVSINKSVIMKNASIMYKSESNKEQKASFAELLSWTWAVAKQSLYTYLTTGYANIYIIISEA